VRAALREAAEEVGLQPETVQVLGGCRRSTCRRPASSCTRCSPGGAPRTRSASVDPAEVAGVVRVPLAELVDPATGSACRHPSGWVGPGFEVGGLLVWGFTAGVVDRLLPLGGWELPWDPSRSRTLDAVLPQAPPP
jgi:8-oxo-dGTP pyrophosphatase MutT (NUDIX family)